MIVNLYSTSHWFVSATHEKLGITKVVDTPHCMKGRDEGQDMGVGKSS
jgi:hypothetical protein